MTKIKKPTKTKTPQPKTPDKKQERDSFFTPRYATELIIPFIPEEVKVIWDVGAGKHNITRVLKDYRYRVISTDIDNDSANIQHNFLIDEYFSLIQNYKIDMLVSNIPFSLKPEFINKAMKIGLPFCFLMPFDMSGYLWEMFKNSGLQAIVPERRIDFITPNTVSRVNDYVGIESVNKEFRKKYKMNKFLKEASVQEIDFYQSNRGEYVDLKTTPEKLLRKVSSSDFHSFWACYKVNLKKDFTFVELSNSDKDKIL